MILHILTDSPYTYRYIDFINGRWDPRSHKFLVLTKIDSQFRDYYHNTSNCHPISGRLGFLQYANLFFKAQKIIFHQLNQPRLLLTLMLLYPSIFRKCVWSIWGGDAYFHRYKTNALRDNLIDKIMGLAISKIPYITGYIPGDFEIVKSYYKSDAKYIKSKYPSPVDIERVKALKVDQKQEASTNIMVGNSGAPSNEHMHAFMQLSKYRDEKIKILSVLSYGGNREYIRSVIESGKSVFGDKFLPIIDYMSFEDFLNLASSIDIAYFSHKRQQGLGNLYLYFALGKKIFISRNVTPYDYYKSIGISLFPIEEVTNMSFDEFVRFDNHLMERNKSILFEEIDLANIKKEWENVFNA